MTTHPHIETAEFEDVNGLMGRLTYVEWQYPRGPLQWGSADWDGDESEVWSTQHYIDPDVRASFAEQMLEGVAPEDDGDEPIQMVFAEVWGKLWAVEWLDQQNEIRFEITPAVRRAVARLIRAV